MAERARPAVTLGCLLAGVALALLPAWLDSAWALAGLLLAQPLLLLSWSAWRGREREPASLPWHQDLLAVSLLWWLAFALVALLLAWPLAALLETGALVPALLLSACAGFSLIALWRLWPAFALGARRGQAFTELVAIAARAGPRPSAWGLLLATLVFVLLAGNLLLMWPGVVTAPVRLPILIAFPLASLLLHAARASGRAAGGRAAEAAPGRDCRGSGCRARRCFHRCARGCQRGLVCRPAQRPRGCCTRRARRRRRRTRAAGRQRARPAQPADARRLAGRPARAARSSSRAAWT